MNTTTFIFDGSLEGLLTAVFESYDRKLWPDNICTQANFHPIMFCEPTEIVSDTAKAQRVWNGLTKKLSADGCNLVYYVYLSELPESPLLILSFIRKVFQVKHNIEQDFGDETVLRMWQIGKKVARESQRVKMFLRFQKTGDGIYYASFDPEYNVLALSVNHFKNRFADQRWVIYDTRRNIGFYYDLNEVSEVSFTESRVNFATGKLDNEILDKDELLFQQLWKTYFKEMEIKERHNYKLHRQLMPKRFWKYLIEKN